MRTPLWLLLLFSVVGCRSRPVEMAADVPLEVTPPSLDFGQTYVGARLTRALTLRNVGKVARPASLALEPPFATTASSVVVGGGDEVQLEVTATPMSPGTFPATLTIDGTEVALRVEALPIPTCAAPGPCETTRFDPSRGQCVVEVAADGATCGTTCVTNGVCTGGVCRGQSSSCDDQNQCTLDACSEGAGCVHQPIACVPPDDPCQAAYCDAAGGCQKAPVEDGVRCGPEDCARNTARVCITGACVVRTRPQGELCFQTLVGVAAGPGRVDGRGDEARFFGVRNATTDRWGTTYVFGGGEVRRVTPGGVVSTLIRSTGGPRPVDGIGRGFIASPSLPTTDAFGNAFVFDVSGHCVRKITPTGVLSTVAGRCEELGPFPDRRSLVALSDGRLLVSDSRGIARLHSDGGLERLHPGSGPLAESPTGELLYTTTGDAGQLLLVSRSASGAEQVVRGWPTNAPGGERIYGVTGLSPTGALLVSWDTDAGCALAVSSSDGGISQRGLLAVACRLSQPNVTTLTGSPVFNSWLGRDERGAVFERGLNLQRLGPNGLEHLAGKSEQPGQTDGYAPTASVSVTAGFGFTRQVADPITVWPDQSVLFADARGSLLRRWRDDGGLSTIDAGASSVTTLQLGDGGAWVKSSNERRWFDGVSLGPPELMSPTVASDGEAFFEPNGTWVFSPQLLVRLDARHTTLGVIRGSRALRDGPLPDLDLDGGWVDTDAGTADFDWLHAPAPLASDRVALLDLHSVRVLTPAGLQTLAGSDTPGFVDGPAAVARFNGPLGLASAPNGDLYVADTENNAIRVLTTAGLVRTVGRLTDRPAAVSVAPNGDVYVLVRHALLRGR